MSVVRRFLTPARLIGARAGSTVVEFALIVPVLLVLYVGAVEVSQGIAADRKLDALTSTMGDLVARLSGDVPRATIRDYFTAATPIMLPFDADDVAQRITLIEVSPTGVTRVAGSVASDGTAALSNDAPVDLPASVIALSVGNRVVMAEAWYAYHPVLGAVIGGPIPLAKRQFFVPRSIDPMAITGI